MSESADSGAAAPSPWESPAAFPERPSTSEYGFLAGGKLRGCSREELVRRCSRDEVPAIHLVWTPEHPRLVPPAEVSFLREALLSRAASGHRINMVLGFFTIAVGMFFMVLVGGKTAVLVLIAFVVPGALMLFSGARGARALRSASPESVTLSAPAYRFQTWLATRRAPLTTAAAAVLVLLHFLQLRAGIPRSIQAAGLVKPAVLAGEAWRLLTGPALHANFYHLALNLGALLSLGRTVEVLAGRPRLALALLTSTVGGSAFSLALLAAPSVGVSGGLMGLIGFLVALGVKKKRFLGAAFVRSLVVGIVLTAAVGIAGFEFIDNAAHLGGLLAGLAAGLILVPAGGAPLPLGSTRGLEIAGCAAELALIAAAVLASIHLWRA